MTEFVIALVNGTVLRGEYVGAMDGYLYLSTPGGVERVKQVDIVNLTSKEVADER